MYTPRKRVLPAGNILYNRIDSRQIFMQLQIEPDPKEKVLSLHLSASRIRFQC